MKDYLINSGNFNIIVRPGDKTFYILGTDERSSRIVDRFVAGDAVDYSELTPSWFSYSKDEVWQTFDGKTHRLHADLSETDLINQFVEKKFNFGGIVAVRDNELGKVRVFKRDKVHRKQL